MNNEMLDHIDFLLQHRQHRQRLSVAKTYMHL